MNMLYIPKLMKMEICCLYVDDLILTGNNQSTIEDFKKTMAKEFEMTYIDLMSYYLEIEV